ncbi:cell division protein FtsK [Amycolatopsis balhimycina DSM 5908]|uniref:Cell division protein FtsK n=1 Tax=Amycolatopsis balhimycina DSM 5908 TaxID=1081091 RepID=A0A428VYU4_AMYBA|nr:FtsK/SpoIIIE domain-containing protein [Amycolatopsis balhimycina]RSM35983.1 cell division protein FtsK [Amycolatopsis balhimycina DSM 5908]
MNADENASVNGATLPARADSRAVEHVGPVLDGELIDDTLPQPRRRTVRRRFVRWWLHSPRVPLWLKSKPQAVQATKDTAVAVLRSPWRYLGAVVRGVVVGVRWWRGWVRVADYRTAAEESEKLADKFTEIRELTLFRWKVTGAVLAVVALAVAVVDLVYGSNPLWIAGAVLSVALAILGRRKDGSPGRKPALAGPRTLTWTMDPQVLVDAFRDAKLIGKDESLRLVERAMRVGDGWAVTVDLPATRKAADASASRFFTTSALAVDEVQLIVERVRGNGGHAGRVSMWVADEDPYASPPLRTPLLGVSRWDAWRPVPFGRDARDRRIDLPLVWTSLLVGAIPRQSKTFAARLAAAGLILDAWVRLYVADFKAGKDWDAAAQVAHRFMSGDEPEHVLTLVDWLVELVGEVQGRFRRMRDLDDLTCPESKVTPDMSRDASLNMPITAVFIDEVQVPLEDRTPVTVQGKKLTAGEYVGELLTWLAKKGPAAGIVLVLATQRPDSKTIPSGLRAVLGSRFALRVMDWRDSNIVLGEQMNTRGFDSSRLLPSHKGVGILRPDGDTAAGADVLAMTVRTYYMPNEDWQTICQQGRALREAAGTLSGHAAGEDARPALDHAAVARAIGSGRPEPPPVSAERVELPEPLAAVVEYLGDDLDDGRDFVPTAELVEALDVEPTAFGRQMGDHGCRSERFRVPAGDGRTRQVRGYATADIRAAVDAVVTGMLDPGDGEDDP